MKLVEHVPFERRIFSHPSGSVSLNPFNNMENSASEALLVMDSNALGQLGSIALPRHHPSVYFNPMHALAEADLVSDKSLANTIEDLAAASLARGWKVPQDFVRVTHDLIISGRPQFLRCLGLMLPAIVVAKKARTRRTLGEAFEVLKAYLSSGSARFQHLDLFIALSIWSKFEGRRLRDQGLADIPNRFQAFLDAPSVSGLDLVDERFLVNRCVDLNLWSSLWYAKEWNRLAYSDIFVVTGDAILSKVLFRIVPYVLFHGRAAVSIDLTSVSEECERTFRPLAEHLLSRPRPMHGTEGRRRRQYKAGFAFASSLCQPNEVATLQSLWERWFAPASPPPAPLPELRHLITVRGTPPEEIFQTLESLERAMMADSACAIRSPGSA